VVERAADDCEDDEGYGKRGVPDAVERRACGEPDNELDRKADRRGEVEAALRRDEGAPDDDDRGDCGERARARSEARGSRP
jgi:hypothetical protein